MSDETADTAQAQQAAMAETGDESIGDVLQDEDNQEYIKTSAIFFAVAGVGLGLLVFLLGEFGSFPYELAGEVPAEEASELTTVHYESLAGRIFEFAPFLAVLLASGVGLLVGLKHSGDSRTVTVVGAASTGVGVIVFGLLASILASSQMGDSAGFAEISGLDFGSVIVILVLAGIAGAVVGAGSAYAGAEFDSL